MKKVWISCLFLLWLLAGMQLVRGKQYEEDKVITEVFAEVGEEEQSSIVEYYGVYKNDFLKLEERELFLYQIAEELGITDDLRITRKYGDTKDETRLVKETSQAATTLRFITVKKTTEMPAKQYMIVNIEMKSTPENAIGYRKKLDSILSPYSANSRSSANIIGSYPGKLTLEERNSIADKMLEQLGANIVSENRDMRLYTIYAYTPYFSEYELQDGQAVNINIAMYYSESNDETRVYAAIPIVGLDY